MKTLKLLFTMIMFCFLTKLYGIEWTQIGSQIITGDVYGIHVKGDTVYLFAGTWAWRSYNKGETWDSINVGQNSFYKLQQMKIDSKGNVYASLYKNDSTRLLKSSDGCKSFYEIFKYKGTKSLRYVINNDDCILLVIDKYDSFDFYRSEDYGKNWTKLTWDTDIQYFPTLFSKNNKFYAISKKEIFVSEDKGQSFSKMGNAIPFEEGGIDAMNIDKNGNIYLGAMTTSSPYVTYILKSTDNGQTWQTVYNFNNSWQGTVTKIEIDNNSNVYVSTVLDGIVYSTDGGSSWSNIGGTMQLNYCESEGRIYSIHNFHLAYIPAGTTHINTIESKNIVIYPNPAKNYISIQNYERNTVKISDINGRIYNLTVSNNKVDISNLSSGIYFILDNNKSYKFFKK